MAQDIRKENFPTAILYFFLSYNGMSLLFQSNGGILSPLLLADSLNESVESECIHQLIS
jgi:hypothetical protein